MKRNSKPAARGQKSSASSRLLEIALLALPWVALTPNFFIIPNLSYQGNATQELAFAWAVTLFLGLAMVMLYLAARPPSLSRDHLKLIAPLAALLVWQLVSLIWAPEWTEAARLSGLWFGFAVFFTAGYMVLRSSSSWWLFYMLMAVILILSVSQFIEYWTYGGEMLGVFFSHGITTELLALTLPLLIAVYLTAERRWLAVLSIVTAGAGGAAIILTLRRGAMIGLIVAAVILIVALIRGWMPRPERWRLAVVGVSLVIFLAGPLLFKRDYFLERMKSAFELRTATVGRVTDIGLTSRLTKWLTAWEMGKDNAIIGVGHGGFPALYGPYRRHFIENPRWERVAKASEAEDYDEIRSPLAHNEFLQIFAELGIIGLLLFTLFWAGVGRLLWRARHSAESFWVIGSMAGLTAFAISSAMSAFSFRFSPGTIIAACVAAIGAAAARRSLKEAEDGEQETAARSLPRMAVIGGLGVLLIAGGLLILRARDVLASQKVQSRTDFQFSLESPAINESLVRRYQRALDLDPANSGAHLGLGLLLYQMKRPAEAMPHVEYALRHSYSRPYAYLLLAFAAEANGDLGRAVQLIEESLASFPRSLVTRAAYVIMLEKTGRMDLAEAQKARLIEEGGRVAWSWLLALRLKSPRVEATAQREGLLRPEELEPMLIRGLVQARAYHYLSE